MEELSIAGGILEAVADDDETSPIKRVPIFWFLQEFERRSAQGGGFAGEIRMGLKVLVEGHHQLAGAGRIRLPLADYGGGGAGDQERPAHADHTFTVAV